MPLAHAKFLSSSLLCSQLTCSVAAWVYVTPIMSHTGTLQLSSDSEKCRPKINRPNHQVKKVFSILVNPFSILVTFVCQNTWNLGKKIGKGAGGNHLHDIQDSEPLETHPVLLHLTIHKAILNTGVSFINMTAQFSPRASNIPVFVGNYTLQHLHEGMKPRAGRGSRVSLLLEAASLLKIRLKQSPVWPLGAWRFVSEGCVLGLK